MRNRLHVEAFTLAAGRFLTEMARRDGSGSPTPADGNHGIRQGAPLRQHGVRNAAVKDTHEATTGLVSFGKEHRESAHRKVDLGCQCARSAPGCCGAWC
jgi:hypothetical protein